MLCASLVLAACTNGTNPDTQADQAKTTTTAVTSKKKRADDRSATARSDGLLLSSSFEGSVCGRWRSPKNGCEFGVEGGVEAGDFEARTGAQAVRIDRTSPNHMGVIADLPLPEGRAFVGAAHRIPELVAGTIPDDPGHLQLEQLSVTDGSLPGMALEVRLFPDRRLGLGLFRDDAVVMADWAVPVDEWFYVVVEVANGSPATQRMWLFDDNDQLMSEIEVPLQTRQSWAHEGRTAQKLGGSTASLKPLFTYVDDWYVATDFQGPLRIDDGDEPVSR